MVRRAEASGMFQAYEMHTYIISIRFSRTMLLQPDPTRIEEQHGFSTCRDLTAHARATLAADAFVGGAVTQRLGTGGLITGLRSKPK